MPELTSTESLDLEVIKSRSVKGVFSLISRSLIVQGVSTLGFFLLTVFLNRSDIGIFFAVTEIVAILGYFSDIGLAASLIQKKQTPSTKDLRTTFTIQQSLVIISITIVLLLFSSISRFYSLSSSASLLLLSLLAGFFLSSLKTIPSILLERSLKFEKLAFVEVLETISFYTIAVFMAWQQQGLASYSYAILARGILGTSVLYLIHPWSIGISFSRNSLKELLGFGLPYQLNTFLAVIKDRLTNLLLFRLIGADGIGILAWAQTWSQKPLRLLMDNVTKVSFPAFSRMQDHQSQLTKALEKSLFLSSIIIFPVLVGFAILSSPLIELFPQYSKWKIAILPLYFYIFSSLWASISTPLTNFLNATGKIHITFRLMVMWTILTIILMPLLALQFGYIGVAYATALISLSSLVPIIVVYKLNPFALSNVILPLIACIPMGIISAFIAYSVPTVLGIASSIVLGSAVYLFCLYLLKGPEIIQLTQTIFKRSQSK